MMNGPRCEHHMVFFKTKKGPNIKGCIKCLSYYPCPHPFLDKEEVEALLVFGEMMTDKVKKPKVRKYNRKKRIKGEK